MKRIIMLMLLMFGMISGISALSTTGNEAYWTFDNTLIDSTGNNHTLTNNGPISSTGKIGTSYLYNGTTDYMILNATEDFNALTQYTICGWFNATDTTGQQDIIGLRENNFLIVRYESSKVYFYQNDGTFKSVISGTVNSNEWIFFCQKWNGTTMEGYIDGASEGTVAINSMVSDSNDDQIGRSAAANYFEGLIDEVSVWTRVLNDSEVLELYNAGVGLQYPYITTPLIQSDIQDYYNSENITINVNTTSNVNMTYVLDNDDLIISNGLVAYYQAENNANDRLGLNNGTWSGTEAYNSSVNYTYGRAFDFEGGTDYINLGSNVYDMVENFTYSVWINPKGFVNRMFIRNGHTTPNFQPYISSSNRINIDTKKNDNTFDFWTGPSQTLLTNNQWQQVTIVFDNYIYYVYIDGDFKASRNIGQKLAVPVGDMWISRNFFAFNGSMDEVRIYNRSLNQSEITQLYETSPYAAICEDCNSSSFNLTDLSEELHNIKLISQDTNGMATVFDNFTMDYTDPALSFNNNTEWNNGYDVDLSSFNITSTDTNFRNVTIYWDDGTINVSTNGTFSGFKTFLFNGNHTFNITATDEAFNNNTQSGAFLLNPNVYLSVQEGGSPLTNFTFGGRQDVNGTVTYTTYNDVLVFGNNTLEFQKIGYQTQSFTFELNTTSNINQTFNVSLAQINVLIKDKNTGDLITGINFSLEFIATVGLLTSTTTGAKNISGVFFLDEEYILSVSNIDYVTERVIFDFTAQEVLEIDVFMIEKNDSNLGFVKIFVVDRLTQPIVNAKVQALQWFSSLSDYSKVSEEITSNDGIGNVNIILDDKTYIFRAIFGDEFADSVSQTIDTADNGKTITITLAAEALEKEYLLQNLVYSIGEDFNNVTNISTVTVDWITIDGLGLEMCINSYRSLGTSDTLTSSNCMSDDSSSFIQAYYINSSYTNKVKVEVKLDNSFITLKTFVYEPDTSVSNIFKSFGLHIFIIPLFFLLSIGIGILTERVYIGTILLALSAGVSLLLAPSLITGGIVTFLFFVGWVTIWGAVKPK